MLCASTHYSYFSLHHIPLALLAFLSPLSSLPVFFRKQRFSLCLTPSEFPSTLLQTQCCCSRYSSSLLLCTALRLHLYHRGAVLHFFGCRDTAQLPLRTLLLHVYKQRAPLLLLDTGFFAHPNFLPSLMMFLLRRNSASYGDIAKLQHNSPSNSTFRCIGTSSTSTTVVVVVVATPHRILQAY